MSVHITEEHTCPCEEYINGEIEGCHECPYVEVTND